MNILGFIFLPFRSFIFLKVFIVFLCLAQSQAIYSGNKEGLKVITYNVWGLPVPIKLKHDHLQSIAQSISYYKADIIGLQETFTKRSSVLTRISEYPFSAFGNPKSGLKFTSSGLLTISKYPILRVKRHQYTKCSGFDCFAAKGVLLTTIDIPNIGPVDVYNTHLNAGKKRSVKWAQLYELETFIKENSNFNPIILIGDLNITPDSDYHIFLTQILEFRDTHLEWVDKNPDLDKKQKKGYTHDKKIPFSKKRRRSRLDYIFHKSLGPSLNLENKNVLFDGSNDLNRYSDHFAVFSEFLLNTKK